MCHHLPPLPSELLALRPNSSDPLTSLRFEDRSQKRKRQKLLSRADQLIAFTLAG